MSPDLNQALTIAIYCFMGLVGVGLVFAVAMLIVQIVVAKQISKKIRKVWEEVDVGRL